MKRLAVALVVLLSAAAMAVWLGLRASLPTLDGDALVDGLGGRVSIARDAHGVPTITARSRADLARGLGYAHGQDRYFQMDLLRRAAAGELAALLGPALLPTDRQLRLHRFRNVARAVVAKLDPASRELLDAYTAGVNAGLASLRGRPFEYWLLRIKPEAWRREDGILCVHAMFLDLQDSTGHAQLQRGLLRAALPESLWRAMEADAPEWDAAVDDSVAPAAVLPTAAEFDLRSQPGLPVLPPAKVLEELGLIGSNNWAVGGSKTATGAALIANDMHLGYRVPTIWYRARLILLDPTTPLDLTGVTLPGTPSTVAGSNGSIAWGFTNSYGEFATVIRLRPVAAGSAAYLTATGPEKIQYEDELLDVHGAPSEHLEVATTRWGPILGKDWEGHAYALQWSAQDATATNLNVLRLEQIHSAAAALEAASQFGIPGQNLLVADSAGHIGWTIAGRIPKRHGSFTGVPQWSDDPGLGPVDWLPREQQPRVLDPTGALLWSANARVVGGAAAALIGDDGMDRGARAQQIRNDLREATPPFTPAASLQVQLDDRALFLERWRRLMAQTIERQRALGFHEHDAAATTLTTWSGHAAPNDAAYRLVAQFRSQVAARAFFMLVAPARQLDPEFRFEIPSTFEGALWRLLEQRPLNLLASRYPDWDAFLSAALRASEQLPQACSDLASCTWGNVNTVHTEHPLSKAVPLLASFLDMPAVQVPGGHQDMPRIQGRDYGASERFSVSPGHEAAGYFHMPGGQSGHPLSPFYRAGFSDWALALPAPFLPGPTAHTLTLVPKH